MDSSVEEICASEGSGDDLWRSPYSWPFVWKVSIKWSHELTHILVQTPQWLVLSSTQLIHNDNIGKQVIPIEGEFAGFDKCNRD